MKRIYTYRKFWLFIWILFCQSLHAQVKNVGPVLSYQKTNAGIEGKTSSAIFEVRAYNDNTIRVRVSRKPSFENFSYALVSTEFPVFNSNVMDKGKTIEIATKDITVVVEKVPAFRVRFLNRAGQVINEDVAGDGFGTTFIGDKVSSYKVLQEGERFVGLGEVLGNLDKRGSGFTLNNTDTYKYGDPRLSMYISIPFYIGIHHDMVYGLFYNNTYKTFFNFGLSTPFTSINAEGGDADYFLVYDTSVANVLKHYSSLTGRMPMPPKWSIGYHQSRCSYYPQDNVKIIAETFRRKQIPVDCIVLDADYLQDYEPFRINTERFPDMRGLTDHLRKLNIEVTASVNPGIKIDSGYEAHRDGLKKDVFVKYSNGDLFVSDIAPSTNHFVDFTNPKSRQWWIDKMKFLPDYGIHGYWNDMNEPAVGGSYLPDNLWFDFDGRKANALEAKNVYGFQMARSSYESALKYGKGKRPFVLTRSAFAGVQRYSAVWSGDNTASDEGLLSGVLLNSQMGLSGLPFVGPDLGGYIGDGTKDLFKRWMEVGVFSPFVRNHKGFFTPANEPWSYGEEAEAISKSYIGFRYRLMPYIYSKFYESSQTGIPVARSLALNYPFNEKVYDNLYQYQFLFGDALMVVPVTTQEAVKKVYLPEGEWFDMFTDSLYKGQQEFYKENPIYLIPIYVKGSSIIPMQTLVQSTKDKASDTLFIHIYNGSANNDFEYYEDEGDGFEYQKKGYYKRTVSVKPADREIKLSAVEGNFPSVFKKLQLVFHGYNNGENFRINNHSETTTTVNKKVLDPLEYLADYYDKNFYKSLRSAEVVLMNKAITIDNSREEILVKW